MRVRTLLIALALAVLILPVALDADVDRNWEKLGEKTVERRAEKDEIVVTAREGRFTAIKLKVRVNGVNFKDLKVHFGDGDVQDVQVRKLIPAGGETREIDLDGNRPRVIRKVSFVYKSRGPRRAVVVLWGKHRG
jgi:hypothetical protein